MQSTKLLYQKLHTYIDTEIARLWYSSSNVMSTESLFMYSITHSVSSSLNPLMAKYSDRLYSGTEELFYIESTTPYNP